MILTKRQPKTKNSCNFFSDYEETRHFWNSFHLKNQILQPFYILWQSRSLYKGLLNQIFDLRAYSAEVKIVKEYGELPLVLGLLDL